MTENDLLSVVSVDVLALAYDQDAGVVCLAVPERTREPFLGRRALPGVVLQRGERLADAAGRALAKFTSQPPLALGQLLTFDEPNRDPRGPSLSIAMWAVLPALDTTASVALGEDLPSLAFDHGHIIDTSTPLLRDLLWRNLPFTRELLPMEFTTRDARQLHIALAGNEPHLGNLNRLIDSLPGVATVGMASHGRGRPTTVRTLGRA
jgi:8-oxo-dGTP diphosphatase